MRETDERRGSGRWRRRSPIDVAHVEGDGSSGRSGGRAFNVFPRRRSVGIERAGGAVMILVVILIKVGTAVRVLRIRIECSVGKRGKSEFDEM